MSTSVKIESNVNDGDGSEPVNVTEEPQSDSEYGYGSNTDLSLPTATQRLKHGEPFLRNITRMASELHATTDSDSQAFIDGLGTMPNLVSLEINYHGNEEQLENLIRLLVPSTAKNSLTRLNISLSPDAWCSFHDLFTDVTIRESFESIGIGERRKAKCRKEFIIEREDHVWIRNSKPSLVEVFSKFGYVKKVVVFTSDQNYAHQVKEEVETIKRMSGKPVLLKLHHGTADAGESKGSSDQLMPLSDRQESSSMSLAPTNQHGSTTSELVSANQSELVQLRKQHGQFQKELNKMMARYGGKKSKLWMKVEKMRLKGEIKGSQQKIEQRTKLAKELEDKLGKEARKRSKRKENQNGNEKAKRIKKIIGKF